MPSTDSSYADKLHLLIIDDDEVDQMLIRRSAGKTTLNAVIHTAKSATEGLQLLQQHHFDCAFVDFRLPDMDGLELMEKISRLGITTPVLIVTSHGDERIAAQAIRLGASDYLPKSLLTPEGIYHSVRTAIRLKLAEQEKLRTEERLRTSQAQLEFLISNTPTAFWSTDAQGMFKFAKGLGFTIIGINPAEILGKSFYEVFQGYPRILNRFERTLKGEVVQSVDETNGHFFKSHYIPAYNDAGNVAGVTGFAMDITERVHNERELVIAKELAEKSVRVKEQFLANISHEIRTPMNGIIGLANVLHKTNLDQEQHKYLNAIRKSADNLMQIINDLLDFSKISANQFTFEEVEFNLQELLQDVIDLMENKASERNNRLSVELGSEVPLFLNGDPLRLKQVVLNLVGNAIKFTENGGIKLTTNLAEDHRDRVVLEFTVEDTGIGIPEEKLHVIFESFNQGSNDTTRKYGGTGLGLTISKNIVEMQGGAISVRSQPQQGSSFTFSIPFKKVIEVEAPTAPFAPEEDAILNKLAGTRVLLSEDNEINQLLINTVLSGWGVVTDNAINGLEAIEKAFEQPYDLILMDMQMPEMDGYEAIEKIRASDSPNADLPIIALTAHTSHDEIQRSFTVGANAYLPKPFEAGELFKTMVRLLSENGKYKGASVNMKALRSLAGDNPNFMIEVLRMYVESTPAAVKRLVALIQSGDTEAARVHLGELYDSVAVLSAKPLQFTFERMASALLEADIPRLRRIAEQALAECNELTELLQRELDKLRQETH